ncbi:MAG: tRNA lysidine(34) synthetase TilS [Thiohalocapsa sp.]|jgi:tRNA(Ile)-lysidine synthase|uniref:tRNA lysidine(34) synthetase TilS n=1 Tax=Thiohalocapsa sp. TaxID=2497641 RepID=UPI0025D9EE48|nr:tRNA lysidine(34) synthetase TilS [Thiohalocapsa sp.]MCG6943659.1 tRNA lysidine(34) synthetase TilS [Thiohalocapsa sp.]
MRSPVPAARERLDLDRLGRALADAVGHRLWIAYSGGLDSHVLLHAAVGLRVRLRLDLRAVHVHHGLLPDADAWTAHSARVCAGLGVPLEVSRLALTPGPGESVEAVARDARYAVFRSLLRPGDVLATAQHRDDQAETLLLALLRGAGVHGLAAMPARAPLGAGLLLRPLLALPRAALADYARAHRLRWVEDPSNADPARDRNRLRNLVIPGLRERWPALDRTLARSAAHCAEAAALLDGFADELLTGLAADTPRALSIRRLRALDDARLRLVLRRWFKCQGWPPPDSDRVHRIITELLPAAADRQPRVSWPGCEVRRHRDALHALAPLPRVPDSAPLHAAASPLVLPPPLGDLDWAWADAADAKAGVSVCFGASGLRCERTGRPGAALKGLFQELGVPAWLRPYVPSLLVDGRLVGIGGVTLCDGTLRWLRWRGHPWEDRGWFLPELARGDGR